VSGPYTPTYQVQATVVLPTEAEAVELAQWLSGTYTGEAVVFQRLGEQPNLTLMRLESFGERP
jgi:hypothetical protein